MGFYIRKSVNVGPLRFNLSKSGIGISTGIRGFRIGSGPRGNYVHMGRNGFYYRQTLPALRPPEVPRTRPGSDLTSDLTSTHGPMNEITSGPVSAMVDSSSAKLFTELNEKSNRFKLWPVVCCATVAFIVVLLAAGLSPWLPVFASILGTVGTIAAYMRDQLANSVVVMYDLDESMCGTYRTLISDLMKLNECGGAWNVSAQGQVYDPKYHAGADSLVHRNRLSVAGRPPRHVKTNISIACVPLGRESLYFMPDLILVASDHGFGAIAYADLEIAISESNFIEGGAIPRDAAVVGRTWEYVNKDGGPDRRFNSNRELPICRYEEIRLSSASGLNELIQVSRSGCGEMLKTNVNALAQAIENLSTLQSNQHESVWNRMDLGNSFAATTFDEQASGIPHDSVPTENLFLDVVSEALVDILCSVMVVDGRVSKSERKCIVDLLRRAKSQMTDEEVDRRIDHYIGLVTSRGYRWVLAETLLKVPMFARIGKQEVLIRCIDAVVTADSNHSEREKALCNRIKQIVNA